MKKTAALFLIGVLLLGGCVSRPGTAEAEPTAAPELTATSAPTPTPTIKPTPTPSPSPTPEPTPALVRGETETEYTLFTGTSPGAAALRTWLMGEGAEITAGFFPERVREPAFSLKAAPVIADIPTATDATRIVRLATDRMILESGLLEAVLPGFESRCGYTVEVFTGDETAPAGWADSASADAALLSGKAAASVSRKGYADVTVWFTTNYTLQAEQPETEDTAGVTPGGEKP